MAILLFTPNVYGEVKEYILHPTEYKVYLNGNEYKGDQPVLIYKGSTYMPLRAFSDKLGLNLNWFSDDKRIDVKTINDNMNDFSLPENEPFGEGEMTINGLTVKYGKDAELSTNFVEVDGKKYISKAYVFRDIATNNKVYMFMRDNSITGEFSIAQDLYLKEILSDKIVATNIPTVIFKNREFIDYNFYLEHIKDI